MILENLKERCSEVIRSVFGIEVENPTIEFPDKFGDLALNCFHLAKALREAPPAIATKIAGAFDGDDLVTGVEAVSGYVNFTVARPALFESAISAPLEASENWGSAASSGRRIMIEFSSPNTNKPQHLGHLRNNCLGESVSRLLEFMGHDVKRGCVINNRGIHICKSMLAYQKFGNGETPSSTGRKGDHLVGDYYVRFETSIKEEFQQFLQENPEHEGMSKNDFFKVSSWGREAQEMLQKWEDGDPQTRELCQTMNDWVMDGFNQTYETLGIRFDRIYLESETYLLGKDVVDKGLEQGVFYRREDGAVEADLTSEKLDKKVVLRSDGTSVYITQDLGATIMKIEEFDLDAQIIVTGDEQLYHFRVLFTLLGKLGYSWAGELQHLAYGMVNLPEGRMKSREGTVVDTDDLINEVTALSLAIMKENDPSVDEKDHAIRERATKIGLGALKFMILNVGPNTTMTYDPEASVSFDGDTGPYVMYAFARIRRMMEDSGIEETGVEHDPGLLGDDSEVRLGLQLLKFPAVVKRAAQDMNPAHVAGYLLGLARAYHSHNRAVKILKAEDPDVRQARLALSLATANTLKRGLGLLGIETVDRM